MTRPSSLTDVADPGVVEARQRGSPSTWRGSSLPPGQGSRPEDDPRDQDVFSVRHTVRCHLFLDPAVFDPEAIDAETLEFNADLQRRLIAQASLTDVAAAATRAAREEGEGVFAPPPASPRARDIFIPGPGGDLHLRLVEPAHQAVAAYLHFHGGGWVFGSSRHQDPLLVEMADAAGVAVLSVDYRLAPEHPYPAAPDDAEAAARWLAHNALAEFGTERFVIGGESAGANLSVTTLVRLRDRHGFTGFEAVNLVSGVFDLTMTPSMALWGDDNLVINTPRLEWLMDHYAERAIRRTPDVSPIYAALDRLPPALFTIGTLDPLLDDSVLMAARWLSAGSAADLAVYAGGVHTFWYFETALARSARREIARFFTNTLAAGPS